MHSHDIARIRVGGYFSHNSSQILQNTHFQTLFSNRDIMISQSLWQCNRPATLLSKKTLFSCNKFVKSSIYILTAGVYNKKI